MTVDFCYKLMKAIINKSQQGYLPPAQFNIFINQAQTSYLDYLLGEFNQYAPGRPVARVEIGMNQILRQRLAPMIDSPSTLVIDGDGKSPYPAIYEQIDAMYTENMQRVRYAEQDKLYSYLNSVIDPVATNPIYLIEKDGFQFYPKDLGNALISYVRIPDTIEWAFILDDKGRAIYDAGNSTDPIWQDADMLEIISRALNMVGVNLQAPAVLQYSQQIKQVGQ